MQPSKDLYLTDGILNQNEWQYCQKSIQFLSSEPIACFDMSTL